MACALVALYKLGKRIAEWLDEIEKQIADKEK